MPKPQNPDHKTKAAVLEFIREFVGREGYTPTVREIMRGVGLRSTSAVAYWLARLEEAGEIERPPGKRRVIKIVQKEER